MSSIAEDDLLVGSPIVVGRHVLRPLARRTLASERTDEGFGAVGQLTAVGLLVEGPEGVQALGLDGEELPDEPRSS